MASFLQAVVFDFDGVIANTEPLHLRGFQAALDADGLSLSSDEYYKRYLGYDDVGVFRTLYADRGRALTLAQLKKLLAAKERAFEQLLTTGTLLYPGAVECIERCAATVPIAIASGALRGEIEAVLGAANLLSHFRALVSAEDTPESKPSPAPYRRALEILGDRPNGEGTLVPGACVAIEDSHWGIRSAQAAGLRCVAVTQSYAAKDLPEADLIVPDLAAITLDLLNELVQRS